MVEKVFGRCLVGAVLLSSGFTGFPYAADRATDQWKNLLIPEPRVHCAALPDAELDKFPGCLKPAGQGASSNAVPKNKLDLTWFWLDPPPIAICDVVPDRELERFDDCAPKENGGFDRNDILNDIESSFLRLQARYKTLTRREDELAQLQATLPLPAAITRLETLERIRLLLDARQRKANLLTAYANATNAGFGKKYLPVSALRLGQISSLTQVYPDPSATRSTGADIAEGTTVLLLGFPEPSGRQLIYSTNTEFGFVDAEKIKEPSQSFAPAKN